MKPLREFLLSSGIVGQSEKRRVLRSIMGTFMGVGMSTFSVQSYLQMHFRLGRNRFMRSGTGNAGEDIIPDDHSSLGQKQGSGKTSGFEVIIQNLLDIKVTFSTCFQRYWSPRQ